MKSFNLVETIKQITMKKITSLVVMLGIAGAMNAQLVSKKGENYLPQAGDWSIGIDGGSMVNYFGNMLNNSAGNGLSFDYTNVNSMITGKMFKTDKMAYRGALRIGMNSGSTTTPVADLNDPAKTVDNVTKTSKTDIGLGAGLEMRRGSTRLQGYYGAMAVLGFNGGLKTTNTYGNGTPAAAGNIKESKAGNTMSFGVRGFIGAEYFVLPKISLAGEFGWGLGFSATGASSTTTGNADGSNTEVKGGKSSTFGIDTDNNNMGLAPAGNLMINFHF
jgi:hypothetical protein